MFEEYDIVEELWRTKGSFNQHFCDKNDPNVEKGRKFYILSNGKKKIWVKEYLSDMGDIDKEYDRTIAAGMPRWTVIDGIGMCRAVRCYGKEDNKLFFEYLDYGKLSMVTHEIKCLLKLFVKEHSLTDYDLNFNNILYNDKPVELVLIDFEPAGRNPMEEL